MSSVDTTRYATLGSADAPLRAAYYGWLFLLVLVAILGFYCAHTVDQAGHHITGMNNHIVWGLPHVFAISLIVSASGALNGASLASVFGQSIYRPWSRLSVLLAVVLLIGGLAVLVLDLGRPDRLIIAMTHYNFRSIFTWNIFLYTGFVFLGLLYLWMMMEKRFNRFSSVAGSVMFVWRIVLTSGTGCIFGFLVARNALDTALLAPLFIVLSLVLGTSVFSLVLLVLRFAEKRTFALSSSKTQLAGDKACASIDAMLVSQARLLFWFLLALVYLSIVHHLTNLYLSEHHDTEAHLLSGPMSGWFWFGHVMLGIVLPLGLLGLRSATVTTISVSRMAVACAVSVIGGWCLLYSIIIGSQSTPQVLFPDKVVLASRFGDAGFPAYSSSLWEWGLGLGGVAIAGVLCMLALQVLPFLPVRRS